jgi:hypothetical protein
MSQEGCCVVKDSQFSCVSLGTGGEMKGRDGPRVWNKPVVHTLPTGSSNIQHLPLPAAVSGE